MTDLFGIELKWGTATPLPNIFSLSVDSSTTQVVKILGYIIDELSMKQKIPLPIFLFFR